MDVAALFNQHHGALVRYLDRLTGDRELANDAAQEAFMRIQQRPPRRSHELRAWLFRVATNVARDAQRQGSRRRRLLFGRSAQSLTSDPPMDPAAATHAAEVRAVVRTALQRLNPRERRALMMREEGFSHREIAEAVETTTGSVGTILVRALEKLARELPLDEGDAP